MLVNKEPCFSTEVDSPHKGQWCRTLMFSLICAWINGWVNNQDAGDLRRHRIHCDVIVMSSWLPAVRPHYNTVKFLQNIPNRPPIARSRRRMIIWSNWYYHSSQNLNIPLVYLFDQRLSTATKWIFISLTTYEPNTGGKLQKKRYGDYVVVLGVVGRTTSQH